MQVTVFILLFIVSFGYFIFGIYKRFRVIQSGQPDHRNDHPRERLLFLLQQVFLQKNLRRFPLSAIFHSFIMWGFIILSLSSIDMAWFGLFHTQIPFIGTNPGFILLRDMFLVLAMIGVLGFTLRRLFFRPDWLHNSFNSYSILALISAILLSDFFFLLFESNIGGGFFLPIQARFFWWLHFILIFSFFFIIPRSKHLHLIFAPFNIYWRSLTPKGALHFVDLDLDSDTEQTCGAKTVEDFTWKQLLDTFSCVKCGICHGQCPAQQSNEYLRPKRINGRIRSHLEDKGSKGDLNKREPQKVVGEMFGLDFISNCTTCGGCNNACPVSIDHISKIIDMRRTIVSENLFSPQAKQVFEGIEKYGNPWGNKLSVTVNDTSDWIKDLNIPTVIEKPEADYLFFIGCQGRFETSAQNTIIAFAKLLQAADIDFAILGENEWCCGETVRRMGNELLFQKTVRKNIVQFNELGVKNILTTCPHCFNTLKNEYPQFGGYYNVIHHSVFLADLLRKKKLNISQTNNLSHTEIQTESKTNIETAVKTEKQNKLQLKTQTQIKKITFHDPCYLSHHNELYQEPREILRAFPEITLTELPRTKELSFCCGAGGGRFWESRNMENQPTENQTIEKRTMENSITTNRVEEILAAIPDLVVTSCPYCQVTLNKEIGKRHLDKKVNVIDIAELFSVN